MTNQNDDLHRPDTEEDGLRTGTLRLLRVRQQYQAITGRTHASLPLPSDTQLIAEAEGLEEEMVVVTPELQEASKRFSEMMKRRLEA